MGSLALNSHNTQPPRSDPPRNDAHPTPFPQHSRERPPLVLRQRLPPVPAPLLSIHHAPLHPSRTPLRAPAPSLQSPLRPRHAPTPRRPGFESRRVPYSSVTPSPPPQPPTLVAAPPATQPQHRPARIATSPPQHPSFCPARTNCAMQAPPRNLRFSPHTSIPVVRVNAIALPTPPHRCPSIPPPHTLPRHTIHDALSFALPENQTPATHIPKHRRWSGCPMLHDSCGSHPSSHRTLLVRCSGRPASPAAAAAHARPALRNEGGTDRMTPYPTLAHADRTHPSPPRRPSRSPTITLINQSSF